MKCPCEIDHWLHAAAGLQGIASIMQNLRIHDVPVSDAARLKFETELKRITEYLTDKPKA